MKQNEEIFSENNESADDLSASAEKENVMEDGGQGAELVKLQNEVGEQKDKFIRLYSEFENFRRRTAREKIDMIQLANESLLKTLLPVVDDFERATKSFKDKDDQDLQGFVLIYNKFRKTLEQTGVKVMELSAGSEFNADLHEAITQIPVSDDKLVGKIVDVVESGYLLNEKVIRHAKVVIGSK